MPEPGKLGRLPAPDSRDRAFRVAALLPPVPTRRYRYYWNGEAVTEEPCGVHWLLDLRWIALGVVVLVGLVVVFTRLMR